MDVITEEFKKAIESLPIFAGVEPSKVDRIVQAGALRSYARGAQVIRESDPFESLFLVVSGRLIAESRFIHSYLGRGDTIGGMSVVGVERAYFSVRVQHDAVVFTIPLLPLHEIVAQDTTFLVNVLKLSAVHLNAAHLKHKRISKLLVAVYSAPAGVGKTRFAANLAAALAVETSEKTVVIDVALEKKRFLDFFSLGGAVPLVEMKDIELKAKNIVEAKGKTHEAGFDILRIAHNPDRDESSKSIVPLLSNVGTYYHNIIIDLPPVMDETIWGFLRNADVALILTSPEERHLDQTANLLRKLPISARVIVTRATPDALGRSGEIEARLGHHVEEVFEESEHGDVHADRKSPTSAYSTRVRRLARLLSGKAWGLALSAGAARGTSHVGVLRVLEEEGLVPDYVAGTSIGALIGAMWCLGRSANSLERVARKIRRKDFFSIADLAFPPSPALFKGRRIQNFLERVFGGKTFADLKIPLKVMATDIDSGELVVMNKGLLAKAVAASVAIPGLLRPVEVAGGRLMDGAVIMPVPVAPLTRMGISRIVAVNVIPTPEYHRETEEAASRRFLPGGGLFKKLFDYGPEEIPNIIDIIGRANLFMESLIAEQTCSEASVIIRPWLPEIHWIDFDASPRFIDAGARAAREALPEIRALVES